MPRGGSRLEFVKIQKLTETDDLSGGFATVPVTILEAYAKMTPLRGGEELSAGQLEATALSRAEFAAEGVEILPKHVLLDEEGRTHGITRVSRKNRHTIRLELALKVVPAS